ncbi:MAG: Alpha-aminoadipate--LysW ligase LysX [Planctomycetota bacterium]|jgi:glutathione synthase/RimK-type ligase-like ATP-grasp enzyme
MRNLVVVNDPKDWSFASGNFEVVAARNYLTHPSYSTLERVRVVNLCRSLAYQKTGYYVSLLADARDHRPLPSNETIQNMKSQAVASIAGSDLQEVIEKSLHGIGSDEFTLSVYFGRNLAERHAKLAMTLFLAFPCPYLQAHFVRNDKTGRWRLDGVKPLAFDDIPPNHVDFAREATQDFVAKPHVRTRRPTSHHYDLAILVEPEAKDSPSNKKALQKFVKAGNEVGFNVEFVQQADYGRLAEFDALFIRCTTSVNHYTDRFACRAKALGMPVIDDPVSILRCSNKVYLAEMADQQSIPVPNTMIVHRGNVDMLAARLGFPMVLKVPDSSFSVGVVKVADAQELDAKVEEMLKRSDLLVAQGYVPTEFDWRIGVLDGVPLYACRYYMADGHWQILKRDPTTQEKDFGRAETLPVEQAPPRVVKAALKAANTIGRGLYGVDLKEVGGKVYMIEVNDNPNIDAGFEDQVLGDELYLRVMRTLMGRLVHRRMEWDA